MAAEATTAILDMDLVTTTKEMVGTGLADTEETIKVMMAGSADTEETAKEMGMTTMTALASMVSPIGLIPLPTTMTPNLALATSSMTWKMDSTAPEDVVRSTDLVDMAVRKVANDL